MVDYFDSSVFVAAISEDDVEHESACAAWQAAEKPILYSHGLLETFATLTGGRHPASLPPDDASDLIEKNIETSAIVQFNRHEIIRLLKETRRLGVRGGAIYDYMHLCAARKAGADRIFTLNKRHFMAIAPDLSPKIFHPADI